MRQKSFQGAVATVSLALSLVSTEPASAESDPFYTVTGQGGATRQTRVVGGFEAEIGEYPFYSGLIRLVGEGYSMCGASVIAPNWLLTAAHCVQDSGENNRPGPVRDPRDYRALPGGAPLGDQASILVRRVIPYPEYAKDFATQHDIALIELEQPTDKPNLATANHDLDPPPGLPVRIIGYGTTSYQGESSDKLKEAHTRLVSRRDCAQAYGQFKNPVPIDHTRICADVQGEDELVDSCQGDSGGPLLSIGPDGNWMAVGIVSFGYKCAEPGFFGVYTNVAVYRHWIDHVVAGGDPAIVNPPPPAVPLPPAGEAPPASPTPIQQLFDLVEFGGVTIKLLGQQTVSAGDMISFSISSRLAGDLFVFDIGSGGDVRQLFPNERTRKGRVQTALPANSERLLPHRRDGFRLRVEQGSSERWIVAMVVSNSARLASVAATRGLSIVEDPGDYLREILAAVAEPCTNSVADCAIGSFNLKVE